MGFIVTFIVEIVLLIAAAIGLAIAAGFVADAARRVTTVSKWKDDEHLKKAHTYLSWSATFGWVGLAVLIVLIGLYLFFGLESVEETGGLVTKAFLFLSVALLLATGIFAAIGAAYIGKSPKESEAKEAKAYQKAITAAVLAIVGGVLVGGLFFYLMFHKPKKKGQKAKDDKKKEREEEKEEKKDKIKELQSKLIEEREAEIEEKTSRARAATKSLKKS